jgi:hypothetical protein
MRAQGRRGLLVVGLDDEFDVQLGARVIPVLGINDT